MRSLLRIFTLALALGAAASVSIAQQPQQPHGEAGHETSGAGGHTDLTFWKWVNFAILAGILGWAIMKNAPPFFAARIAEIQKDINEAKAVRAEAESRAASIEKRLANLDAELASLRTDSQHEMEAESVRIQDETRRLIARAGEQTAQEIESMTKAAEGSLRAEAARLAVDLAERKLRASMSATADAALADKFVAGLRAVTRN